MEAYYGAPFRVGGRGPGVRLLIGAWAELAEKNPFLWTSIHVPKRANKVGRLPVGTSERLECSLVLKFNIEE